MLSFLEYFFTGKSRLKKELAEALDEINPLLENLVDWSGDELELMSLIQDKRKVKSAFSSSVEGIICSIYQEHMEKDTCDRRCFSNSSFNNEICIQLHFER
jgi:hypothetical protein